jgi:hypothetical protein
VDAQHLAQERFGDSASPGVGDPVDLDAILPVDVPDPRTGPDTANNPFLEGRILMRVSELRTRNQIFTDAASRQ